MTTNNKGFLQSLWDFFCSLKLAISLIIALAVTSIIGTVIPQAPNIPEQYIQSLSQTKLQLYEKLGFFDMYHSWWYILLLYLFTVNLVACSMKRLPRVWKTVTEPSLTLDEGLEKSLSLTRDLKLKGGLASLKDGLAGFLSKEFSSPVVTEKDGEVHLYAQKNPWCRLGVYVVHLSIVIIFIGAIVGSLFGYKGWVQITEGTSESKVLGRNNKTIDLGFAVKLEKFSVAFYETGAPKEFKSILTVLENGKPVSGYVNIPIVVNDPLTYKGITFYQSSYGPAGEGGTFFFTVKDRKGGAPIKITARQGESVQLPGGRTMHVTESTQDVRQFIPQMSGPAARIEVHSPGKQPDSFIVFRNFPKLDEDRGGDLIFSYDGSDEKFYTGLQVAKDPGVWVVWFGCTLMVIGIIMAFFMSHKRIWVRISSNGRVVVAGSASKNQPAFQGAFEELTAKMEKL
ncbi:cytochrome c biogenesis protein ResB [Geobacter pelophilus]|uniref:Cytochrome c biogenesis protein ResB n=1 Tax=Geoanaerobacter pelophilus TaxID=60036 RepID=A0AAW4KXR9_9BACT|nr:cytochrome c biogenesis protein ResB [Geoanaerobacter pelophilus]MBT0663423.1 cytochrome c biogenesis protein ResB [Geoanaerobacter pelophilus]